jgi:hypothetical protein
VVTVRRETSADVDAVWRVLADGWLYPSWVVGASRMRNVDTAWPAVGAKLYHSLGAWPMLINDNTEVEVSVPDRELVLRGRGWPMGEVTIRLELEPLDDGGALITMSEDIASGPAKLMPGPVRTALMGPRNVETLRRLAYLAEGGSR